jgi:hypothetical protein
MSAFYAECGLAEIISSFAANCPNRLQSLAAGSASPASDFATDL